jgi:hypothetical protein
MTLFEITAIIFIHWIADFVFQDERWAIGKSKSIKSLITHTIVYSVFWSILILFLSLEATLIFVLVSFVAHTITDYITSKIVSRKFQRKEYGSKIPNFGAFTIIGIDQVLHYVQLFSTYFLLK